MAANKAQFIAILSVKAGISLAEATAATNALPEALGEWMKVNGATAPGQFVGEMDGGLRLVMSRDVAPAPHWEIKATLTDAGLTDFGDGAARFGLVVENA